MNRFVSGTNPAMSQPFPNQIDRLYLGKEHLATIASAPCSEVFQALSFEEPLSIREIAEEVNRSTASVGEHIAKLIEVGLIVAVGTRKRRAREETLYAHKADTNILDPTKLSPEILNEYVTKFRCDSRQSVRLMTLLMQALPDNHDLMNYTFEKSYGGYINLESAKKIRAAMQNAFDVFNENIEHDSEARQSGEYIRVKFTGFMVPTQRESEKRIKKP